MGIGLVTGLGDWNLDLPFLSLPPLPLDASGRLSLPLTIPPDPGLVGLTVGAQYGQPLTILDWGLGFFLSVPEPISFTQ